MFLIGLLVLASLILTFLNESGHCFIIHLSSDRGDNSLDIRTYHLLRNSLIILWRKI